MFILSKLPTISKKKLKATNNIFFFKKSIIYFFFFNFNNFFFFKNFFNKNILLQQDKYFNIYTVFFCLKLNFLKIKKNLLVLFDLIFFLETRSISYCFFAKTGDTYNYINSFILKTPASLLANKFFFIKFLKKLKIKNIFILDANYLDYKKLLISFKINKYFLINDSYKAAYNFLNINILNSELYSFLILDIIFLAKKNKVTNFLP